MNIGGETKYRRWQQVDFVVDDQAPVVGVEEIKVGEDTFALGGEYLIRGNGDRTDLFACTGVFADLIFGQGGALE